MDNEESPNIFHQLWKRTQRKFNDLDTGSRWSQENPEGYNTSESQVLHIERIERAVSAHRAERLCSARKSQNDAVLGRLGISVQDGALPSLPRISTKPPMQARRMSPLSDGAFLNKEDMERNRRSLDKEDNDTFWEKVLIGSQMASLACKEAKMAVDSEGSPTGSIGYMYTSADAQTPSELRAIPLLEVTHFKPSPPPPRGAAHHSCRRLSRLPVFTAKIIGEEKEMANGCRLQSATSKVQAIMDKLERIQRNYVPVPRPQEVAKRSHVLEALAPTPPTVSQTKKRRTKPGTISRPVKRIPSTSNDRQVELQPLTNPWESLSLFFQLLSSDDWSKKMTGLMTLQALARYHSEYLTNKLHEVCLVLIEEVKNLRSSVACAAMDVLAELYVQLQKTMDPEVERTGRALLLKLAQTTNDFIIQQANLALDAMVENCSHGRIMGALLNTGMSHRCVAVRGSMAQHLHQLANSIGAAHILTAGKSFTMRFLIAVSKMCVDAAPQVRHYGQMIFHDLALHKDFLNLWTKIIPEKERGSLDKILKNAKK